MATSGTTAFSLDLREIAEEAYERAGLKLHTGYDLETALRSLNLLFIEWQNRGINFWTIDEETTTLVAGTATHTLDADAFDAVEFYIREGSGTTQVDLPITRISVSNYSAIPNKNTRGRPTNIWLNKQRSAPVATLWPTPDQAYTLVWQQLSRIEDSGKLSSNNADVPYRFLPVMVAGLAYKIAQKKNPSAMPILKADYEEQWALAEAGDRDRASWFLRPNLMHYSR